MPFAIGGCKLRRVYFPPLGLPLVQGTATVLHVVLAVKGVFTHVLGSSCENQPQQTAEQQQQQRSSRCFRAFCYALGAGLGLALSWAFVALPLHARLRCSCLCMSSARCIPAAGTNLAASALGRSSLPLSYARTPRAGDLLAAGPPGAGGAGGVCTVSGALRHLLQTATEQAQDVQSQRAGWSLAISA